jgi:hypothetical protein
MYQIDREYWGKAKQSFRLISVIGAMIVDRTLIDRTSKT